MRGAEPRPGRMGEQMGGRAASKNNKAPIYGAWLLITGGERGIRTLDTLLTYTHFPGVLLQPLGHLSGFEAAGQLRGALIYRKAPPLANAIYLNVQQLPLS